MQLVRFLEEGHEFIRLGNGTNEENIKQEVVGKKILNGSEVYLDAISALFLAETGLLQKINPHIPNLKIPQSVINFLFDTIEKFRITPGSFGHMGYANGKIRFNPLAQEANPFPFVIGLKTL